MTGEELRDLAQQVKSEMNKRLAFAPAAEAFVWLARRREHMGWMESAAADVVAGWTLARGPGKWSPMDRISLRQIADGIGVSWGPGNGRSVNRALTSSGVLKRFRLD